MEWRCEWCGKPHEANDPPCDNCGHGSFEQAVVQQANEQDSTVVWVCTDCGREHTKHSPPCSRCGNAQLERTEKVITDENLTERPGRSTAGSPAAETMTVWVCSDCGKEHTKHSPPCSRCGGAQLEQETKTISDDELATPGYLDLITPRYAVVLGVVLLIAVTVGLGAAGVVDLPFFPDNSVPSVDGVPGNESTANGLSLGAVETAYVESVNAEREANGLSELERDDRLDEIARFDNQQRVKAAVDGDTSAIDERTAVELIRDECQSATRDIAVVELDAGATPQQLGSQFSIQLRGGTAQPPDGDDQFDAIGVDAHAVGSDIYLYEILCDS